MKPRTTGGCLQKIESNETKTPVRYLHNTHPPMIMEFLTKIMPESQPEPGPGKANTDSPTQSVLPLDLNPNRHHHPSYIIYPYMQ